MLEFLLSVPLLTCVIITLFGISFLKTNKELSNVERGVAIWHLTNATWFSFGCDVLSGYF